MVKYKILCTNCKEPVYLSLVGAKRLKSYNICWTCLSCGNNNVTECKKIF